MMIMAKHKQAFGISLLPLLHIILLSNVILNYSGAAQLQSSQSSSLLRIKELLNHPTLLTSWNNNTDFCNIEPTSSVTVVCYEENITQLHIIGSSLPRGGGGNGPLLPPNFSIDSFVTTLAKLPTLKVLTLVSLGLWGPLPAKISRLSSLEILNISSNRLNGSIPPEISSLQNLQTLILDHNLFSGPFLPADAFPALAVLSLRNNSFQGSLPQSSLAKRRDLRVLDLAFNHFLGQVPDLSGLANLEHLDLENNSFGPQFPRLGSNLVTLSLKGNKFRSGVLDEEIRPCYQLQKLDISSNELMGPLPAASLLSLPSLAYLNVSRNKFTGMLFSNMSCNPGGLLESVDLSSNLLTGSLPNCLVDDDGAAPVVLLYGDNCMSTKKQGQHPYAFCRNEALAAGVLPNPRKKNGSGITTKAVAAVCAVVLGAAGAVVLLAGLFYLWWLARTKRLLRKTSILQTRPPRLIGGEHAPANTYTRKLLSDARYISQTMKLGALGVQAYRTFSLEELEEATNNFDTSAFMGEGSHGQMYRGELKDGSFVAIRCVKLKMSNNTCTQQFMPHIELISKLRHRHLVSAIGHCFECYLEDSSVSRLFLVFEYVPNGTLTSWIVDTSSSSARNSNNNGQVSQQQQQTSCRLLSWSQRITTAIGVAKGIQFLHTGIVPGIFSNNIKTTDVLLDQNLVAKISSYNLPLLAAAADNIIVGKVRTTEGAATSGSPKDLKPKYAEEEDKSDVYDFGLILLEMIVGRSIKTKNELNAFRNQVQAGAVLDDATRRSIAAPEIEDVCSDQSLKTMMEICSRCTNKDPAERPSIEDILWNLQFAAQVQDAWQRDSSHSSSSSSGRSLAASPPHQLPRLGLALQ